MASRSSARIENLPLTRNVAAKLSAPEADKDDARSFDASTGKNSRHSSGDKMRAGGSENGGRGDVEREVRFMSGVFMARRAPLLILKFGGGTSRCYASTAVPLTFCSGYTCGCGRAVLRSSHV